MLPSATEIVCLLGLRDHLVGVTHECDFPNSVLELPRVTKTLIPSDATSLQIDELVRDRLKTQAALYSLDMQMLETLQPDLIVTQALCDVCAVAEAEVQRAVCTLASKPRVVNLAPNCLADVLGCVQIVGEATGFESAAAREIALLQSRIQAVHNRSQALRDRPTVMLLEWIDPPFCAGHWSPELVEMAGGREVIGKPGERSNAIAWETIVEADPDVLFFACCGFDIDRTMQDLPILKDRNEWSSLRSVKAGKVFVVDGSAYFNRPGPRLVDSLEILAHALHPSLHPLPIGLLPARFVYVVPSNPAGLSRG